MGELRAVATARRNWQPPEDERPDSVCPHPDVLFIVCPFCLVLFLDRPCCLVPFLDRPFCLVLFLDRPFCLFLFLTSSCSCVLFLVCPCCFVLFLVRTSFFFLFLALFFYFPSLSCLLHVAPFHVFVLCSLHVCPFLPPISSHPLLHWQSLHCRLCSHKKHISLLLPLTSSRSRGMPARPSCRRYPA